MRVPIVTSLAAVCFLAVGCGEKSALVEKTSENLSVTGVVKLASQKCDGVELSKNSIPCLVAENLYRDVELPVAYRCLIVVHDQLTSSNTSSLNSLSRDGLIAWGKIADLKYEDLKAELTQVQQDFILRDAENPMNLRRWSEVCSRQYLSAEQNLRQAAFSEVSK